MRSFARLSSEQGYKNENGNNKIVNFFANANLFLWYCEQGLIVETIVNNYHLVSANTITVRTGPYYRSTNKALIIILVRTGPYCGNNTQSIPSSQCKHHHRANRTTSSTMFQLG